MTIEEQLKQEILSKYKSVRAFANAIGVPNTTLDSALKRGIGNAGIVTMLKVFGALDLDIESVQDGSLRHKEYSIRKSSLLSSEAIMIARDYDGLDRHGKTILKAVATEEKKRIVEETLQKNTAVARSGDRVEVSQVSEEEEEAALPPSYTGDI